MGRSYSENHDGSSSRRVGLHCGCKRWVGLEAITGKTVAQRSKAAQSFVFFVQTSCLRTYPPLHYPRTTQGGLLSASLPSLSTSTQEVHNVPETDQSILSHAGNKWVLDVMRQKLDESENVGSVPPGAPQCSATEPQLALTHLASIILGIP